MMPLSMEVYIILSVIDDKFRQPSRQPGVADRIMSSLSWQKH